MKPWEIIADNLSKAGWSWGCVSVLNSAGLTIWIVDAHRGDGKRFILRVDEKLATSRTGIDDGSTVVNTLLAKNYNIEAAPHH